VKSSRTIRSERKQPLPEEVRDSLLDLVKAKFYQGHGLEFLKQRRHLLAWVVLWPASWLDNRGVTLPAERYRSILSAILVEAAACMRQSKVNYLPAYLKQVVQSHFRVHGEDYYAEAKSMRAQIENAMLLAGQARSPQEDPVRQLAQAARLLKTSRPQKPPAKGPSNQQLNLL
jgi:hypothetical protein